MLRIARGIAVGFIVLAAATEVHATRVGSCADQQFHLRTQKTMVDDTRILRVLVDQAPVFSSEELIATAIDQLAFDTRLDPVRFLPSRRAVEVRRAGEDSALGWMHADDLLCNQRALTLEATKLDRKLFIQSDNDATTYAYPSPVQTECGIGACRPVTRFELYFILAEDLERRRLLVSQNYNPSSADPLVGWIDQSSGIEWNTVLGLQPLRNISGYNRLEDAVAASSGEERTPTVFLQAGSHWYSHSFHVPLLDTVSANDDPRRRFYRFSAPGVGLTGYSDIDTTRLERLKDVDIFFVLDGTYSMRSHLESARSAVSAIVDQLTRDPKYSETSFRFGFRVYRDDYAGNRGVGEGLPLSADNCQESSVDSNRRAFIRALEQVVASTSDGSSDRTLTENLFAGLEQAFIDIEPCGDRTKLLFVIGDAGDNDSLMSDAVLLGLHELAKPPILFFISPESPAGESKRHYDALERFRAQGLELIAHALGRLKSYQKERALDPSAHLLSLSPGTLPKEVKQIVGNYSRSDWANLVIQRLRNGEGLEEILTDLRIEGDMPVVYMQLIHSEMCERLGPQCKEGLSHGVTTAYSAIGDAWQEEVWVTAQQLENWVNVLRKVSDRVNIATGTEKRQEFIETLVGRLETDAGEPKLRESGLTMAEFLEKRPGLPGRADSPLLRYTIAELEKIPICELNFLMEWVAAISELINRVLATPQYKVDVSYENYPEYLCPNATEKGRAIQRLIFSDERRALGRDPRSGEVYSYEKSFRGDRRYWIPRSFLP